MQAPPSYSAADRLFWLAGAEPLLLRHAYTDRTRFISLGLSVAAATLIIATAVTLSISMATWAWLGWGFFPIVLIGAGFCLHRAFAWVWEARPERFGRRLALLALILAGSAALFSWPVQRYVLGPVTHQASQTSMQLLVWAIRLTVLLVLLVPVYATAVSSQCAYARTLATRHSFHAVFSH